MCEKTGTLVAQQFAAELNGNGWRNRDDRHRTDAFAGSKACLAVSRLAVATIDAARGGQMIAGMDGRLTRQRPQDQQKRGEAK
ncbi:MAG: hypothetical protein CVT74_01070 [Alphaproteobacteria bacterium HGW-Alphaproteobacteria-13]|nr:MAG: hypothetical protein CVT74_01070 [Alphaproteobacteria bacterium HGW-Alphaproteobacteria-13]